MSDRHAPLLQARLGPPCPGAGRPSRSSDGSCCSGSAGGARHHQAWRSRAAVAWLLLLCCSALAAVGWQAERLQQWHDGPGGGDAGSASAFATTAAGAQQGGQPGQQQQQPARIAYPVWWHAPFYTGTGYSTEAISYVSSLLQTNRFRREDIWVSHSGDQIVERVVGSLEPDTRLLLQEQEYNALVRGAIPQEEMDRPAIAVCHTFPDCWQLALDKNSMHVPGCPCPAPEARELIVYKVGRSMFETSSLPQHLVDHCNAMDEVWVPTEFNRQTFAAAGVDPSKLHVVPQGIDAGAFDPQRHQPLTLRDMPGTQLVTGRPPPPEAEGFGGAAAKPAAKPYVFLSVFKWETRKGWDVLLESYLHEFRAGEPVELHIMTKPFGKGQENFREQVHAWLSRRFGISPADVGLLPPVFVHAQHVDDATYPRLYASADCVVLPTRGEGWGRPQMEAMAMARPVITTNWSGPTAYISEAVAYPLRVLHLAAADEDMNGTTFDAKDVNEYFKGQTWAQPDAQHLRQLMRHVFAHPAEAAAKGRAAREHVRANFAPEVIAGLVMAQIMRIQGVLGLNRTVPPKAERAQVASNHALCLAYPDLCKQGPAGLEEAGRRARASFTKYKTHENADLSLQPGRMTVAEVMQQNKAWQAAGRALPVARAAGGGGGGVAEIS